MRRGDAETASRGETEGGRLTTAAGLERLRASAPPRLRASAPHGRGGFTLIELVVTITVMAVLALGAIPLVKTAVKRQKEQQLRESLRMMREAIKEFRRDTVGMQCTGGLPGSGGGVVPNPQPQPNPGTPNPQPPNPGGPPVDPRSTVVIADCTIFGVDNTDRYPPDLDTLVGGVNVLPRQQQQALPDPNKNLLDEQPGLAFKKKIYLRDVPVDPMTGKKDWTICSSWEDQRGDSCNGTENVFDVRSRSQDTALNGRDKYSDW